MRENPVKIYQSKEYEKYIFSEITDLIASKTGRTKKEARLLLVNALAYNTVVEEILEKAAWLDEEIGATSGAEGGAA